MSGQQPVIVWFRQDLRLADNPALAWASATGRPLLLVYVLDEDASDTWAMGAASRWWLHGSLKSLGDGIASLGNRLVLLKGLAATLIPEIARTTGASAVVWNRCYEPHAVQRDTRIKHELITANVEAHSFNSALWAEPWTILTNAGAPFRVFMPFWKALRQAPRRQPLSSPAQLPPADAQLKGDDLDSWKLLPTGPNWAVGFEDAWTPGEAGAHATLDAFIDKSLPGYADNRNLLGSASTSRLSPHFHFGEISPVQVRDRIDAITAHASGRETDADKYMSELAWREFSTNLLFHTPTLPAQNWRSQFDTMEWRNDPAGLTAWQLGLTGYPVVDAGMRELWATGFMHNRARMIVASFLIKDLLIDWRLGAAWFWDTLVDADLANNSASWQWVAGSGVDAAPYFRVFNPVTQGEQYDPDGSYVRKWVPELSKLPNPLIHKPWEAPASILRSAGVELGVTYPHRILDHAVARERALTVFKGLPKSSFDPA